MEDVWPNARPVRGLANEDTMAGLDQVCCQEVLEWECHGVEADEMS